MRVVDAGYEIIKIDNPVEKVERIARVCYKSEDKIKEGSAERMVRALIKSNHTAMIEHASLVLEVDSGLYAVLLNSIETLQQEYGFKSYLRFTKMHKHIVSGNLRAWRDFLVECEKKGLRVSLQISHILKSYKYDAFFSDLNYRVWEGGKAKEIDPNTLTAEEQLVHKDVSVLFTVDRGVSHEIVRHRESSFAQESTRYCNYGKLGVAFIKPCFFAENTPEMDNWVEDMMRAEAFYNRMLENGATPQEARCVLPNSLKTEVTMTANLKGWKHFCKLRAVGVTGKPHPQIMEVAVPLLADLQEYEGLEMD